MTKRRATAGLIVAAVVATAAFGWRLATSPRAAMIAYAAAFVFVATTLVGALSLVMIAHVTGAKWFVPLRRLPLSVAGALPVAAVLFVPVALETSRIYPWAGPHDRFDGHVRHAIDHAAAWSNRPGFVGRGAVCLLVWIVLAEILRRASLRGEVARERTWSGGGLVLVAITLTIAAFDWVMSAIPGWASNMMGVYVFVGAFASAVGATAVAAHLGCVSGVLPREVGPAHAHALGRLLLTGVCVWAYIAFCQVLLIWIANLPSEVPFLIERSAGPWKVWSAVLVFGHFVVPFALLLSRPLKRRSAFVAGVGAWVVTMHAVDCAWLLVPQAKDAARAIDVAPFVALAAVAALVAARRFFAAAPVPEKDPDLVHGLEYESP